MEKCDWCGRRAKKLTFRIRGGRYKTVCSEKCKSEGLNKWGSPTREDLIGIVPIGMSPDEWAKTRMRWHQEEMATAQFVIKSMFAFLVLLIFALILTRIWFILAMIVVYLFLLSVLAWLPDDKKKIQLYVAGVLFVSFTIWGFLPGGLAGF